MSREKELFRDNLIRLDNAFPKSELLNVKKVSVYCGIDPYTAKKLYSFNGNFISKVKLASELS